MKRTERILRGIFFFSLALLASTRSSPATEGWLPVPPEDLALKDNPKQPGADAMILYRESVADARKTFSDGDSVEEYVRIKIFTQKGTKYGHIEIPFNKEWENISYVAGRTIHPDGGIVKFDGQVLETTIERYSGLKVLAKSFTLPDVQPGCIVEYKFQRQARPSYVHNEDWDISGEIFTRDAKFTYIPYTGYGGLGVVPHYRVRNLPADVVPKQQIDGSYSMIVHNIQGLETEPLMPPEEPLTVSVEFFYPSEDAPSDSDSTDKFWNHYAKKWDGELEHFIDKKGVLEQELSKIVAASDTPDAKLRKIYDRVGRIRNLNLEDSKMAKENKDENLKPNANVEDVLGRGYASGREINYLFVGLARAAGFDATEVYVTSRNQDIFLPNRKDVSQLQADLVWVHAGLQEYYLDPGSRFYKFGLLPWYETETSGLRVDKRGATIVNTPMAESTDATLARQVDLELKEDGSVAGTMAVDFTGQRAGLLREEKRKEDDTGRSKDLEDEIKSWLPVGSTFEVTKISNWDDMEEPVHVEGTLKIPTFGSGASRRMLMPLELFQGGQLNLFTAEKRVNPVYFHYPYEEIDDLKFRLPAGSKTESVPPEKKIDLGAASYDIVAVPLDNGVEVKRHLVMKGILFPKDLYPNLRAFFGIVKTNDNAQMVLQSAQSAKNN